MTTYAGTYAKPSAGTLEVVFRATFSSSTTTDAGFPGQTGESQVFVKCRVLDAGGAQIGLTYISSASPSAHILLAYPGGNAAWTMEMSDVYHRVGGIGSVSAADAKATCILIKA